MKLQLSILLMLVLVSSVSSAAQPLAVGFGKADVTPDIAAGEGVWLAGYSVGRKAEGVHDPLYSRCLVLAEGEKKLALVSVDLVGLQYETVRQIRKQLPEFAAVIVCSTHSHEGPDVIGIWGPSWFQRGVDDRYLKKVVAGVVSSVREADKNLQAAAAALGKAEDESLLGDSRQPVVKDGWLRVLCFRAPEQKKVSGLLVQWSAHPEALGSRNKLVTADFPYAAIAALEEKYDCPVVYFSGAVGGLMAPPGKIEDENGNTLTDGTFPFAEVYGRKVAKLAEKAVEAAAPIELANWKFAVEKLWVPAENTYYRAAHQIGVLKRPARVYRGDPQKPGPPLNSENIKEPMCVESEVGCLQLGELYVVCIPGEIYPELVYGKIDSPEHADFPEAEKEPDVQTLLPSGRWLLLGLANDELGYFIPRRQWDVAPPFAYGRTKAQYGEINSCSPQAAIVIMQALRRCVEKLD